MRIGELSGRTGVSPRSLRYYEQTGLLTPSRTPQGWRLYDESDVDRVITIQHLLAGGMSGSTIAGLLPCVDAPAAERTGFLERRLGQEMDRIEGLRRELDRQLEVLNELRDR